MIWRIPFFFSKYENSTPELPRQGNSELLVWRFIRNFLSQVILTIRRFIGRGNRFTYFTFWYA